MAVVNEQIVVGRAFRKLIDQASNKWMKISFWTKASDVEFDDGKTAEDKIINIDNKIDDLKQSFQDGVDSIMEMLKSLGVTPDSNSLDDILKAIQDAYNKGYDEGRIRGQNDVKANPGNFGITNIKQVVLNVDYTQLNGMNDVIQSGNYGTLTINMSNNRATLTGNPSTALSLYATRTGWQNFGISIKSYT